MRATHSCTSGQSFAHAHAASQRTDWLLQKWAATWDSAARGRARANPWFDRRVLQAMAQGKGEDRDRDPGEGEGADADASAADASTASAALHCALLKPVVEMDAHT